MDTRAASYWWMLKGDAQAAALWQHNEELERRERLRIARDQVNERIYASNVSGVRGGVDLATLLRSIGFTAADLNFTRQIVDALVARIGNNQPSIRFDADGADWTMRRQSQLMDKIMDGEMEQLDMQAEAPLCMRAALTTRAGAMKIVGNDGDIVGDRVPVDEFRVDPRESRYGKPRQLHHAKQFAREVLIAKYPRHEARIKECEPARKRAGELESDEGGSESNMVEVLESYHLPSKHDAKDGVAVIAIKNDILSTMPIKRPRFPVAFLRWSPPQRGFWGSCLVDELAPLQFKVNEIARDLMQNIYFTSALAVFARRESKVTKKEIGGKAPYFVPVENPGDVVFHAPDGFSPAQFQFLQWLIQQMYDVSGVSQLMAQSKNPLGAGASGAALSNFYDIESERFSQLEMAYARFWRDCGRLILDAAQDLANEEGFREREVRWVKRSVMRKVKWADVDFDMLAKDDNYQLNLEAAGYVPRTRSGKLEAVEQLIAGGFLDATWAPSLLDFPDLEQANMVRAAPIDLGLADMEQVLDCHVIMEDGHEVIDEKKSQPVPAPIPECNLEFHAALAKALVQQQTAQRSPEAVIARCREWMELIDAELKRAKAAAPAPPMDPSLVAPGAPGPGAAPMPPPLPMGPMSPDPMGMGGIAGDLPLAAAPGMTA